MLGFLKPKPPLEIIEKAWTERRMHWLAQRFGLDRMRSATVVLPTTEFFPEPYDSQPESVARVFEQVCGFMGANAADFDVKIKPCCQGTTCGSIKSEGEAVIDLQLEDVADQERLIATCARAIGRRELLRGNHVDETSGDFDSLSDLLPVFSGLGIFQANTAVKSQTDRNGGWEYWSIRGAGFLQARVPGYAMALMAWVRGETAPSWANMLGTDAAAAFHKGLKYVSKTNDSLFRPDNASSSSETTSSATLADRLRNGTPTQQVDAMWQIADNPTLASEAVGALTSCLHNRDTGVATEAARTLAAIGPSAEPALPTIVENLSAPQAMMRVYCAAAIEGIRPELNSCPGGLRILEELQPLLQDRNPTVVDSAIRTFASYGKEGEPAMAAVVPRIVHYARDCDFGLLTSAVTQITRVVEDPKQFLSDHLAQTDPELRDRILAELAEVTSADESEEAHT